MNAQGSSRTVLFDVGGVLVDSHPDPAAIARMFGDESRGLTTLVDQAMWTHRADYDAGLPDRVFWDRIAGDCGQPEPSRELLKELVALDSSRMANANEHTLTLVRLLRHQGVRVGILSNAPYPIAKASVAPSGAASSTFLHSPATTASVSPRAASTVMSCNAWVSPLRMLRSSMTVVTTFVPPNCWVSKAFYGRVPTRPKPV